MATWTKATWAKGKRRITGLYYYKHSMDRFMILLDSTDPVTGRKRFVECYGPKPNFNGWELVE